MKGPSSRILTAPYQPADRAGNTFCFKVTTAINTAQRLGTLLTVPTIPIEEYQPAQPNLVRPPNHVWIQVPQAAANPVYMTPDNNTAPVVGGPGIELVAGSVLKLELAGETFLRPKAAGDHPVNALTALQFIATAATVLIVTFFD